MKLKLFDYNLPKEQIAQHPLKKRDASRLMVLKKNKIEHKKFNNLADYLRKGDVLVLNNSKVIPAKICGNKKTGGKVELLLIRRLGMKKGEFLVKGRIKVNDALFFKKNINGRILKKNSGNCIIGFNKNISKILSLIGEAPLPNYIKKKNKLSKYQTVYAKNKGSIAAPTAGLHFTKELLKGIKKKKVKIAYVTLHVGIGTFMPVKTDNIKDHYMHEEYYSIRKKSAELINSAKRKIVVGTTSIRVLESASNKGGKLKRLKDFTKIFIYPGYKFKQKNFSLITNFHLPKSTLIMLVSAFAGRKNILKAYNIAIRKKYRFYSFGDAMLLLRE